MEMKTTMRREIFPITKRKNRRMRRMFLGVFAWMILAFPLGAFADDLDVTWEDDSLFEVENAVPGETYAKEITVENNHENDFDVYIDIDDRGSFSPEERDFAKKLDFEIVDAGNGSVFVDGMNLLEAINKGDIFLETLENNDDGSNDEKNTYEMRLTFDKDAGNEYQGRELRSFDISIHVKGEEVDGDSDDNDESGDPDETPTLFTALSGGGSPESVAGEETSTESGSEGDEVFEEEVNGSSTEDGVISGVEDVCRGWPWWVWLLLLILFAAGFNAGNVVRVAEWKKYDAVAKIALGVGALAVWYFFDICREYEWFLFGSAAVMLVGILWKRK